MAVVVIIPTYQRPETLFWSLKSVLLQKFSDNKLYECRIVVLNNDLSTKLKVTEAVNKALATVGKGVFESVHLYHRNPPLSATENFYRGISEHTVNGDVAFIHGDDDIMRQGSLEKRARILDSNDVAFLLTKSSGKVYFFKNQKNIYVSSEKYEKHISSEEAPVLNCRVAVKEDLLNYSIPFVSTYGYKIGDEFWNCCREAYRWADALPFERKIRHPFLPFYMGLSAWKNGQLLVCPENMVMRGQLLRSRGVLPPKVVTEYANTGIILLTGLAVLNNSHLSAFAELDDLRRAFRKNIAEYIGSAFYKRDGVSLKKLFTLINLSNLKLSSEGLVLRAVYGNGKRLFTTMLGLSNIRNRIRGWGACTNPEDFWVKWGECVY